MLSILDVVAVLLFLTGVFGWLNVRLFRLPDTIGLLVLGLAASLLIVLLEVLFPSMELRRELSAYLQRLDLRDALLNGMLAFLLFAGAIHVDYQQFRKRAWEIGALAIFVTCASTFLVGGGLWLGSAAIGKPLAASWCLAFGALISPTDPVAVLSTLRELRLPKGLGLLLSGESLFNDGVGIVLFMTFAAMAAGSGQPSFAGAVAEFCAQALGGALLGLATGYCAYRATRAIDSYPLEILISLALVTGTYAIALHAGVSGPIAIVVSGILLGNRGPADGMSAETKRYFFGLWTLVDQILNAMLFLVIGLEVVVLEFDSSLLWAAAAAVPLVLAARFLAVSIPIMALGRYRDYAPGTIPILTWAGLHGGISIALALSLPRGGDKPLLLAATYAVVLFSLIVQGLSIARLVRRYQE